MPLDTHDAGESTPASTDAWTAHRRTIRDSDDVRVQVFLRSLGAPAGCQDKQAAVFETLDRLEDAGIVSTSSVSLWGDRIYLSDRCSRTPVGEFVRGKIREFGEWAGEREGVDLHFERRSIDSSITGESREMIRPPQVSLAVYADDSLAGVFPCSMDGEERCVTSYLHELAKLSDEARAGEDAPEGQVTVPGE